MKPPMTIAEKSDMAAKRYGKMKAKDIKPAPKATVKPILKPKSKTIGFTVTKRF